MHLLVYWGDLRDRLYLFSNILVTFTGKVTLFCRLLVVGRLLHLVVLVFEGFSGSSRGKAILCCRLLVFGDCYVWSYWFSKISLNFYGERLLLAVDCWLFVTVTSGHIGFHSFQLNLLLFLLCLHPCVVCAIYAAGRNCNGMNYCYCL